MTKIPSAEERVEEFADYQEKTDWCMSPHAAEAMVTADRTALLTELRNSALLEEKVSDRTKDVCRTCDEYIPSCTCEAHNVLARAIKAHLDERIKYTSI